MARSHSRTTDNSSRYIYPTLFRFIQNPFPVNKCITHKTLSTCFRCSSIHYHREKFYFNNSKKLNNNNNKTRQVNRRINFAFNWFISDPKTFEWEEDITTQEAFWYLTSTDANTSHRFYVSSTGFLSQIGLFLYWRHWCSTVSMGLPLDACHPKCDVLPIYLVEIMLRASSLQA